MVFSHLLTQIQVKVVASGVDKDAASAMWGKVTAITINGKAETKATLTLPAPNTTAVATIAKGNGSVSSALPLTKAAGVPADGLVIPTDDQAALFGYAIFLPSANERLTLNITTEKSGGVITFQTSSAQTWAAGKTNVITVKLSLDAPIENDVETAGGGSVNDWEQNLELEEELT
jgi:hypothetical protein